MKSILLLSFIVFLNSCAHSAKNSSLKFKTIGHFKLAANAPVIGKTDGGQEIILGGFSGLLFRTKDSEGNFLFQTITDRGPNGYNVDKDRPFLLPDFSPQVINLKALVNSQNLEVTSILKLKKKNAKALTGLPNERKNENPVDIFGFPYSLDSEGLDTEALTSDAEGGFWVGEEYGPSLVRFDKDGKMQRRITPGYELPKLYSDIKPNRGFEGIAKVDNKLFGFLQSPLKDEKDFSRIAEVDLETMKTSAEYFYYLEDNDGKVGDVVSIGQNQFLIIEQNGKKGKEGKRAIFKITLNETDKAVGKELLIDLNQTAFFSKEKIEGLTVIDSKTIAICNDNDFQIAGPGDFKTGVSPLNKEDSEILIIEFADKIF